MARLAHGQKRRALRPNAAERMEQMVSLALDMEEPLTDATELMLALRLIGNGMAADHNDDGQAIVAVARAALARLEAVRERWAEMVE